MLPLVALAGACSSSDSGGPDTTNPEGGDTDGPTSGEGSTTDGGDAATGPGDLSPSYVDYAVNHVLSTGQSNSVGVGGTPPLTISPGSYSNLMFDNGPMSMTGCNADGNTGCSGYQAPTTFVPIQEGDVYYESCETPSTTIANGISKIALETFHFGAKAGTPSKHDVLVSAHGRSGNTYQCLRKGSCNYRDASDVKPFEQGMMEVQAAKTLADAKALSYVVRAVTTVHGESDSDGYNAPGPLFGKDEFPMPGTDGASTIADYGDAMVEWQRDYEQGVKAITGQTSPVPFLMAQLSGWRLSTTSVVPQMQLDAHTTKAPGKVVIVTPTYMLPVREDCLHFNSTSVRWLGEYFAKAYARIIFQGQPWEPLRPSSITRAGSVITVKYLVPTPPLVIDTTLVTSATNFGYDVLDAGGTMLTVSKVELSGTDSVNITLAAEPTGAVTVRYAQNQPSPNPNLDENATQVTSAICIGPGTQSGYAPGPRGNIHDSDATPSQFGNNLANWSVAFSQTVN